MKIKNIRAREIIDSRGKPTLEVFLETKKGEFVAGVPSGASTGAHEAIELRDNEERMDGKGVLKAVEKIEQVIFPELKGMSVENQKKIDEKMIEIDGTENKSNLGANSILGVSVAVTKAAAFSNGLPLYKYISELHGSKAAMPKPLLNVINGGAHTGGGLDFQEFMLSPKKDTFKESIFNGLEIYHSLKRLLQEKNSAWINIGDEGGFVPDLKTPKEALSYIEKAGDCNVVIDVAATEFFQDGKYVTKMGDLSTEELIDYYKKIVKEFPVIGIEDPLEENDFEKWNTLNEGLSDTLVIGDDLLVTNSQRIEKAIDKNSCNGMILKINQIGTITESLQAAKLAKENNWKIIVSHRSGETNDSFIADFAAGIASQFIKSGAPARGERVSKYNRLLEIEEELMI